MQGVSLRLLVLKTRQLDKLRAFYQALGIALAEERHGRGPLHYAGHVGETTLEVYPFGDDAEAADATTRLGFSVANLAESLRSLQVLGVMSHDAPRQTPWGYRAVVRDPDGRSVELYEESPEERESHGA
jgi:hypothetical protein